MSHQEKRETKKKRGSWFVHLTVFVVVQIGFFIRDTFDWSIFNLNDVGLWFEETVRPIKWLPLYDLQILNYITLIWGVLILLAGILTLDKYIMERKKNASAISS